MSDELMELPEGWEWSNIGTIAHSMQNGIYKAAQFYNDSGIACLRMYNIENGEIVWKEIKRMILTDQEVEQYKLMPGDILINRVNSRELVGKAASIPVDLETCIYESKNIRLRLFQELTESKFVSSWFRIYSQKYFNQNAQQTVGMASINQEQIGLMPIPLPPLNEQKRIVAAIEALRERSQKARSALSAIPELCDKFRQSVLAAAFRGDLTADWREQNPDVEPASVVLERIRLERRLKWQEKELRRMKFQGKTPKDDKWKQKYKEPDKIEELADIELPDLPDGWVWLSADECTSWITDGEHATPERSEEGIYLLSARNVLNGRVSLDKVDFVSEQVHRKLEERLKIEPGDVFLSCSGTVGRSCVVPPDVQCSLVRSVAVLKPLFEMGEYLSLSIRSPYVQSQIEQKKTQTAQSNIFQGRIKTLAIPIAPLNEQKVIIEQITEAFRFIQSVEQIIQLLDDRGEHLDRSILAKAFRGELVEQDPNDEPAAVLLERIRVDREQQMRGKIKKPGKKKRTGD